MDGNYEDYSDAYNSDPDGGYSFPIDGLNGYDLVGNENVEKKILEQRRKEQLHLLEAQGSASELELSIDVEHLNHLKSNYLKRTKSLLVVRNDTYTRLVIEAILMHLCREITFDTKGVNLSRTGRMTVISISLCTPCSVTCLLDLVSIGPSIFSGKSSLKELLESNTIQKMSYDCRIDSNAVFHQYGVKLRNVLDLQVYQLGIKIENGKYLQQRQPGTDYLRGLKYTSGGYLTREDRRDTWALSPPHRQDPDVWGKRPLRHDVWQYAANDVHCISRIYFGMSQLKLTPSVFERVKKGSENNTALFRDAAIDYQADYDKYRDIICRIAPI